jgi:hypothetical protein
MEANQIRINLPDDFGDRYPGASRAATEAAMNLVRTADLLVKRIGELTDSFGAPHHQPRDRHRPARFA